MEKDCNININVEICILITEEEFEERERYYEELYASGGNIDNKKRSQYLAGRRGSNPQATIQDTDFTKNIAQFWYNVKNNNKNVTKLQNSISEVSQEPSEESTTDAYSELDSRAKRHLNGVEKTGTRFVTSVSIPKRRSRLKIIRLILNICIIRWQK